MSSGRLGTFMGRAGRIRAYSMEKTGKKQDDTAGFFC